MSRPLTMVVPPEVDDAGLSLRAFRVLAHLCRAAGGGPHTARSIAEISRTTRMSPLMAGGALKELALAGFIGREPRPGFSTVYWLRRKGAHHAGLTSTGHDPAEAGGIGLTEVLEALQPFNLPPMQRLVAVALASHRDPADGRCDPPIGTLTAETGLCGRAVRLALRGMEAAGCLASRPSPHGGGTRQYDLRLPPATRKGGGR